MTVRDLIRLPECTGIELTDGTYNYTLEKHLSKPNDIEPIPRMYYYIRYQRGHSVQLSEHTEPYFDDWKSGPQTTYLSVLATVGGMAIHTRKIWNIVNRLEFVPRGSFSEFVKRTNTPN